MYEIRTSGQATRYGKFPPSAKYIAKSNAAEDKETFNTFEDRKGEKKPFDSSNTPENSENTVENRIIPVPASRFG